MKLADILLFIFFIRGGLSAQVTDLPDWFLHPARYQGLITGYSNNGTGAEIDARIRYTTYADCIIRGCLEFFYANEQFDNYRNTDYYYYYNDSCAESLKDKILWRDGFYTNLIVMDSISAFVVDTAVHPSNLRLKKEEIQQPKWVDGPSNFSDNGLLYGVGEFTGEGNDNDAWKTAEDRAIFQILINYGARFGQITLIEESLNSKGEYIKIQSIKLAHSLQGARIMERYPDFTNKIYYVLASVPANAISKLQIK